MDRAETLAVALGGSHPEEERAQKAMAYYCKSMQVLGTCARGKMPTTELLCAAKLPFSEMVMRMQVRDPPPHRLSCNTVALITTNCNAMRSLGTKWP